VQWHSSYHHSIFSDSNKEECLYKINNQINIANKHFKSTEFLFITFGTASVFRFKETQEIVSNCHKLPADFFTRELLSVNEIVKDYRILINNILKQNPAIKIIFTVSPIRHWKDGPEANQLSKSTLILACNELKREFETVNYFPAYEIVMDELRDYRFYADDMIHLNQTAIDYIWERFTEAYFDKSTFEIINEIRKIKSDINHKPFNPESEAHKKFLIATLEKINRLKEDYNYLDLDIEKKEIKERLAKY